MNFELYKYGLSNALEEIEETLANALNTTDKKKKTEYIGKAYGMIMAVGMLINEKEECVD